MELCSTPCKVLRFAPTPLRAGPRTLTASARSSRTWLLRDGRVRCGPVRTFVMAELDDGFASAVFCDHFADATRHPLHVARREALIDRRPRARSTASRLTQTVLLGIAPHVHRRSRTRESRTIAVTAIAARLAAQRLARGLCQSQRPYAQSLHNRSHVANRATTTRGMTSRSSMSAQRRHPRHQTTARRPHGRRAAAREPTTRFPVHSSAGTRWEVDHEDLVDGR